MKVLFKWQKILESTQEIRYKNHTYYLIVKFHPGAPGFPEYPDSYSVSVMEDGVGVTGENTRNPEFVENTDPAKSVEDRIIDYGTYVLQTYLDECDKCKEKKIVKPEKYYTRHKEFKGIKKICSKCRSELSLEISAKFSAKQKKDHERALKRLKAKPPVIVGGFDRKYDAYKVLQSLSHASVETGGSGFVYAKSVLTANDGTFYPVICVIDQSSGGELWDSQFVPSNYPNELISQSLVSPFLGKDIESIFPYTYETLSIIPDDFHQNSEFRTMTFENIRHHHTNFLQTLKRKDVPEAIDFSGPMRLRPYFSLQHALSVCQFANLAYTVEQGEQSRYDLQDLSGHRSYCVAAILSAAAFLESTINEFFSDTLEYPERFAGSIEPRVIGLLANMWSLEIPRTATYSIMEKYQIALTIAGLPVFDLGKKPAQDAVMLIKLRNAIIHYEPSWHDTKDMTAQQISKKFQSGLKGKFSENPLTGERNPFFPDKCLSASMIQWLITTMVAVADLFSERFEIIPMHEKIRNHIEEAIHR